MKRTAKILFSTMLVLMFVFQFAGAVPAARAADDSSVISSVFSLWHDKEGEQSEGYQTYADTDAAADFGNDKDKDPTIDDLKENGVKITVPEGLYVESITLGAGNETSEKEHLSLTEFAVLDGSTVKVPASAFADDPDTGENILSDLAESEKYVFGVKFHAIDPDAEVTVTYTNGELNGAPGTLVEGGNEFTASYEDGYTVLALKDTVTPIKSYQKEFAGWKLVYENGISTDVAVGSTIYPYIGASLVAQWNDVIVVTVKDASKTYDGTPLVATYDVEGNEILEEGEELTVTLENGSLTDAGSVECTASASVAGANYTIYTYSGTLTVNPVEIRITTPSAGKIYDGTVLTSTTPTISGEAVNGDVLNVTVTGSITDAGTAKNTVSYTITKADGSDNSANYNISVTEGELTVTPRTLTVTTGSAEADYTGEALTADKYSMLGLVDGHEISVTITGSQTVPGSSDNTAEVKVADAEGNDVTANYAVAVVPGKLTVNALSGDSLVSLTLAPKAASKVYDGTALSASEYEITSGSLLSGDVLTVTYDGSRTDAGEGESSIKSVSVTHDDVDVTENYNIDYSAKGTLTVTQRPITVTADSAEKEYDGTALTKDTASITSGTLVSGHTLAEVEVVGTQTDIGTSANTIKENSVKITDASGNDVTENYKITLADGTLEVTNEAIIDITVTVSKTKVYDGTALTITADDLTVTPALPTGYTISATLTPNSRTDAGKDDVTITNVVIKDADGNDVTTSKFNVTVEIGTLEVTVRPLTVTTGDKTKVYDGTALTDSTIPTIDGQLSSHNIKLKFTGSQTKVGSSDNSVEILSIYDKETEEDVTANYSITYNFGTLTVTSATSSTTTDVDTGDTNNVWLWIGLMIVAAAVVVVIIIIVRKKNKGEDQNK